MRKSKNELSKLKGRKSMENNIPEIEISEQEQIDLLNRVVSGDDKPVEKLISANMRLIYKIAHSYISSENNVGSTSIFEELIEVGIIELITAIKSFDRAKLKGTLLHYFYLRINAAMYLVYNHENNVIQMPRGRHHLVQQYLREVQKLKQENETNINDELIAERLGWSIKKVKDVALSLEMNTRDWHGLENSLQISDGTFAFDSSQELLDVVEAQVKELPAIEELMVCLSYGFDSTARKRSAVEVGKLLNISQQTVSKTLINARKELKNRLEAMNIFNY